MESKRETKKQQQGRCGLFHNALVAAVIKIL
jgi:hypothetical protein